MKNRLTIETNKPVEGNVLYICMRDLRLTYNHCIHYGYNLSYYFNSELFVGVPTNKMKYNEIQKSIMLETIEEMKKEFVSNNLYFTIIEDIEDFLVKYNIKNIILDWSPLREIKNYYKEIKKLCEEKGIFCGVIDTHNIVPCKLLSVYKRTGSSVKIQLFKLFFEYLNEYDDLQVDKKSKDIIKLGENEPENIKYIVNGWDKIEKHKYNNKKNTSKFECNIPKYEKSKYYQGGNKAGLKVLEEFFNNKFSEYNEKRNSPDVDGISNLSPYVHFGILSSYQIIKMAYDRFYKSDKENLDGYLNEIFVWKETSEHFCLHNEEYDNINGALDWAKDTLHNHTKDDRDHIYSKTDLENGKTDDPLWNAAQNQLLKYNKIHGYVRMYWAKQLVKWTKTPEEAIEIGIELNDKYSIDGNDPNGYLGIMWSICGSMDRGYADRPITGKIRPMSKIKTHKYEALWNDPKETEKYLKTKEVQRSK